MLSPAVARQIDALPADVREAVADALHLYAITGRGDIKKLNGLDGLRLRVGRYRAIFDETATEIVVLYVGKRETTTYH